MEFDVCAQCGREIEDKGIFYRKRHFCSDDCCEEFEEAYLKKGEPEFEDLEGDEVEDFSDDDDLDFDEDEDIEDEEEYVDDDDFEIDPDDF